MLDCLCFFAGGVLLFLTCFLAGSASLILSSKEPKGEIVKSQTVGFISFLEIYIDLAFFGIKLILINMFPVVNCTYPFLVLLTGTEFYLPYLK